MKDYAEQDFVESWYGGDDPDARAMDYDDRPPTILECILEYVVVFVIFALLFAGVGFVIGFKGLV